MSDEGYTIVGSFTSLHGYKGHINIVLNINITKDFKFTEPVFVEFNQTWVPFFVETFKFKNNKHFVIKIKDIDTDIEVLKFKGKKIYFSNTFYNKNFKNTGEFIYLFGFKVCDKVFGLIGNIADVVEYPGQYIFKITGLQNEEILLPVNNDFIESIEKKKKTINIKAPEGLLDIYIKK